MSREPPAWGKKYSVALFQVGERREKNRSGMKLIMLISKAAHIRNQSAVLMAIKVERRRAKNSRERSLLSLRVVVRVIFRAGRALCPLKRALFSLIEKTKYEDQKKGAESWGVGEGP